jgi:hypothetical protein
MENGHALEIASKVDELLSKPDLSARVGLAGREFAIERLNWEKNVQSVADLYKQAGSRGSAPVPLQPTPTPSPARETTLPVKAIAFYLPQFHPIKENDMWWGPGFTEWKNVVRGKPMFPGHHQPQLPADLGFYDLRVPEVMQQQAEMAREYGIHGFCFYYYWFNGKKLLERPLEMLLATGKPDFPFCLCWANENWTRAWDGGEDEILMEQNYSPEADEALIRELIPIFKDPRYIRVDGAPLFLVYRVNALPDPAGTAARWRAICAGEGIPSLHLVMVQTFGIKDPRGYGCDAAVEFPPHLKRRFVAPKLVPGVDPDFQGYLDDYHAVAEDAVQQAIPAYTWYRGAMPSWDNSARRRQRAHIFVRSSPNLYAQWLSAIVEQAMGLAGVQAPLVFINAWNEWAEGAHLEPDQRYGRANLEATRRGLSTGIANSYKTQGLNVAPEVIEAAFTSRRVQDGNSRQNGSAGGSMSKTDRWFDQAALEAAYRKYAEVAVPLGLSYATVRDYCESFDFLYPVATANGDLKDVQRPWAFKTILSRVPRGGRLLEIGAGEPWIADLLSRLGYEVWIVDPYDGSGNGPEDFARFSAECPQISFIRDQFSPRLLQLPEHSFDCIYSISVLEHIPIPGLHGVADAMRKFLKPTGFSIHAVDHVHRGKGAEEHLEVLKVLTQRSGISDSELLQMLAKMENDVETYYLSAESHNRWRAQLPYDQFQMRCCVSVQLVTEAQALLPAATMSH